jgi:lysine N6-hydroxylase
MNHRHMDTCPAQTSEILDLIGIGIGPFNLGLASLLQPVDTVKARFFDSKASFVWHDGLLLEDCHLQVPFMADLVTMVDPTSPFSFLNYLCVHGRMYKFYFYERFQIPRIEYNRYCRWVAGQLASLRFGMEVVEVVEQDGLFCVTTRDVESNDLSCHLARNVVLGVGTTPTVPPGMASLLDGQDFVHSAHYRFARERLREKASITIVGNGQSAAECFLDLLRHQPQCGYELNWLTRSSGFFPMEYSKLGLEHFSPDYTDHFFRLPEATRRNILATQGNWYKGISLSTIAEIYDALYMRSVDGVDGQVVLQSRSQLVHAERSGQGWSLSFRHVELDKTFQVRTDAVVLGSGYRHAFPPCMDRLAGAIEVDGDGRPLVRRDYTLQARFAGTGQVFVQNGEMHTHGISAPDLGLGAARNAAIVNRLTGTDRYPTATRTVFQTFGIAERWRTAAGIPTSNDRETAST